MKNMQLASVDIRRRGGRGKSTQKLVVFKIMARPGTYEFCIA